MKRTIFYNETNGWNADTKCQRKEVLFFAAPHFLKNNFSQPHIQAHLVFADTKANAEKPKELEFLPTH